MKKSDAQVPAASSLNAHAPEFTPQSVPGDAEAVLAMGHHNDYEAEWQHWQDWPPWQVPAFSQFPEVVPGIREGEFVGLQCILLAVS